MKRMLLLLAMVAFASGLCAADHPLLPLGSPLPDFKLPGVDGREYTPASFAAAPVFALIFTCDHCPTAQAYEGRIKKLVAEFQPRGVAFLAVNSNNADAVRLDEMGYTDLGDSFAEMKERASNRGYTYPYADDGETQALVEKCGAVATPHVFLFDRDRKLRFEGRIDDSEREALATHHEARDALEALVAGKEPPVTHTKVFGCSIKWKEKIADNQRWREKVTHEPVALEAAEPAAVHALLAPSGKVRVINVWATWCGPCVAEFDELVEQNLRFRQRDFELITVSADFPDQQPKVLAFLQKHHASNKNLMYRGADKYAYIDALDPEWSGALPYTLVLDADGKVLYRETGSLDFLALRRAIVPALSAITPWGGLSPTK
ncbi:MAG TPA: redoxin family protein [Candidatus Didemnitutus sp.]|jgi:thiol-disulfide isomerase/thioredoxin